MQQGPPPAPTNLVARSQLVGVKAKVKLNWQDNSTNENTFEVERCKGSTCTNFAVIGAVSVNETLYVDQRVARTTTYRYQVRTTSNVGYSGCSNIATTTTT